MRRHAAALIGLTLVLVGATPGLTARRPRAGLCFLANRGQVDGPATFYARDGGTTVWLTDDGLRFDLRRPLAATAAASPAAAVPGHPRERDEHLVFFEQLVGASRSRRLEGAMPQPAITTYLLGRDPRRWVRNVPSYQLVTYRDAWDGIDLRIYGLGHDLEQEFVVRPGASPARIRLTLRGVDGVRIAPDGSLVMRTAFGTLRQARPQAYQHVGGTCVAVAARFQLLGGNAVGFRVERFDHTRPLVIDPVLLYSSYLGGVHDDVGSGIAVDGAGNTYVAGFTASQNFPVTAGVYQTTRKTIGVYSYDLFVTKLSPAGVPLYSTFLGGSSDDYLYTHGLAIDAAGNAYVTGQTTSDDFPVTPGAIQPTFGGNLDAFVAKLSADGTQLLYSTYLGGSGSGGLSGDDFGFGIAVDAHGDAYVAGGTGSTDFPTTPGAFQRTLTGTFDAFVAKLNADGTQLLYSTLLGGTGFDRTVGGVVVDAAGNAYVTGLSQSTDFPTTPNARQRTLGGSSDAFLTVVAPDGGSLVYSTLLGGSGAEMGWGIALDGQGDVVLAGDSTSTDFPVTPGAYSTVFSGSDTAWVMKLRPDGSPPLYSTAVGPVVPDNLNIADPAVATALAVDPQGRAYLTGHTPGGFPTTPGALQGTSGGGNDAFVATLSADGSQLLYGTYLGGSGDDSGNGIAVDAQGNAYLTGSTSSMDFPASAGAFQTTFAGGDGYDAFVTAIGTGAVASVTPSTGGNAGSVTLTIRGSGFQSGATVVLQSGGTTIRAGTVGVGANGTTLTALVELSGASAGVYDLAVTNPGGTPITRPAAFTVVDGGAARVWVNVVGRPAIRVNTPTVFLVTYGNSGSVDAYGVPLFVGVPSNLTMVPQFSIVEPAQPAGTPPLDLSGVPLTYQQNGRTYLPLYLPVIPAGSSSALAIAITDPTTEQGIEIEAFSMRPFFSSLTQLHQGWPNADMAAEWAALAGTLAPDAYADCQLKRQVDCFKDVLSTSADILSSANPVSNTFRCYHATVDAFRDITETAVDSAASGPDSNVTYVNSMIHIFTPVLNVGLQCARVVSPAANIAAIAFTGLFDGAQLVEDCTQPCDPPCPPGTMCPPPGDGGAEGSDGTSSVGSIDPNDKAGPTGVTAHHWISAWDPVPYLVSFENEPTASAPAQQVVVTDHLDPTTVDLTSFSFGPIAFGTTVVTPQPGQTLYSRTVDLRPAQDLLVRVAATLDTQSGVVTWTFASIDPATGLPPADPTVGFLPPDAQPPAGDGSVLFTVRPRAGLPMGTSLTNQAMVVFDQNAPITTPTWTNTISLCVSVSECRTLLDAAFPAPGSLTDRKARRLAKRLLALATKAERLLDHVGTMHPSKGRRRKKGTVPNPQKQERLQQVAYRKAAAILQRLLQLAQRGSTPGLRGLPLAPITGAASNLMQLLSVAKP